MFRRGSGQCISIYFFWPAREPGTQRLRNDRIQHWKVIVFGWKMHRIHVRMLFRWSDRIRRDKTLNTIMPVWSYSAPNDRIQRKIDRIQRHRPSKIFKKYDRIQLKVIAFSLNSIVFSGRSYSAVRVSVFSEITVKPMLKVIVFGGIQFKIKHFGRMLTSWTSWAGCWPPGACWAWFWFSWDLLD